MCYDIRIPPLFLAFCQARKGFFFGTRKIPAVKGKVGEEVGEYFGGFVVSWRNLAHEDSA